MSEEDDEYEDDDDEYEDDEYEDDDEDEDDEDEEGDGSPKKKSLSKKLILMIAAGAVCLISITGLGTAYYLGAIHEMMGWEQASHQATIQLGAPVIHEMPIIKTDLRTEECRSPLVKFSYSIQLPDTDLEILIEKQPFIIDGIRDVLRDMSRAELMGKEGSLNLKASITDVVNFHIQPARIQNVTFPALTLQ